MGNSCDKETLDELDDVQESVIENMTKSNNKYLTLDIPRRLGKSRLLVKYAVEFINAQKALFKTDKNLSLCSLLFVAASTRQGLWLVKAVENMLNIRPFVDDFNHISMAYMRCYDLEGFQLRLHYTSSKLIPVCICQDLVLIDNACIFSLETLKDIIQKGHYKQIVITNTFTTEDDVLYQWLTQLPDNQLIKVWPHPEKQKGTMSHFSLSTTVVPVMSNL